MSQNFDEDSQKTSRLGVRWETLRCRQDRNLNPASALASASASGAAVFWDPISFNPDCPEISLSPLCADLRVLSGSCPSQQVSAGLLVEQLSWERVLSHVGLFPC